MVKFFVGLKCDTLKKCVCVKQVWKCGKVEIHTLYPDVQKFLCNSFELFHNLYPQSC